MVASGAHAILLSRPRRLGLANVIKISYFHYLFQCIGASIENRGQW